MQNTGELKLTLRKDLLRAFESEVTDPDKPFGLERADHLSQMSITKPIECLALSRRQLVRRAVAPTLFHEGKRAVVHHEMLGKEILRSAKARGKESPEPLPADLRARTIES